jgi:hypothetical protein
MKASTDYADQTEAIIGCDTSQLFICEICGCLGELDSYRPKKQDKSMGLEYYVAASPLESYEAPVPRIICSRDRLLRRHSIPASELTDED